MWHNSILDTIGNTPLIRLNHLAKDIKATVLVKVEYFNPGHSIKDRIAVQMVEDAEKEGKLRPGGTIIEGTSGNTGMGLALAAIVKGYNCIFTTTDKQSMEKVNLLRALGAEVRICPTNVEPEDPRSYYSVAKRLSEEIPSSYYPNQYDHPGNAKAHELTTGPEIWTQTEGKVTHFVAGMGTGGTVTGTAKYLKSQNPDVKVIGIDSVGSIYTSYFKTREYDKSQVAPYVVEGIGEDILPKNMNFDYVDAVIPCPDKEAFLVTRALAKKEGLFVGGSCGAAVWGGLEYAKQHKLTERDVMVIILPDSGTRYISKIYNDEWMRQNGYMDDSTSLRANEIMELRKSDGRLATLKPNDTVQDAIEMMRMNDISQVPVFDQGEQVGSINESLILNMLITDPSAKNKTVSSVMGDSFPIVTSDMQLDKISKLMSKQVPAVLVKLTNGEYQILTKSDLINAISVLED
ncbi:MAG: pyridoxal-phosphate dependent enzyme [Bacteroidetes bacterium]|nr:pyridoxal-phosphate dependent enzyme [Bacteroidota bacterium]NCQ10860.1 pyridoxal-phosphate dependent enzyme [Bacteroidota bacterium]